jgi:hypothetical protein
MGFLLSGKFLGLLSPFILKYIVNSMMVQKAGSAVGSNLVFWKAGLCVMLWGATKAMSTVLV